MLPEKKFDLQRSWSLINVWHWLKPCCSFWTKCSIYTLHIMLHRHDSLTYWGKNICVNASCSWEGARDLIITIIEYLCQSVPWDGRQGVTTVKGNKDWHENILQRAMLHCQDNWGCSPGGDFRTLKQLSVASTATELDNLPCQNM